MTVNSAEGTAKRVSNPSHPDSVGKGGSQLSWFALKVLPNHEKSAGVILRNRDFVEFTACRRVFRRRSDRLKELQLPLFPGYIFSRFDLRERISVLSVPGVLHIVGFGRTPIPIADEEIVSIQKALDSSVDLQPWPVVLVGQVATIERGPLRGISGIVTQINSRYSLIMSITLLQRSVAVMIDPEWLQLRDE